MADENMSLADAIAPSAPSPAPAPAPASAESPAQPPQPPGAGMVNPYVPPAQPPQNLQTAAAAAPALDTGQPPQGDQPQIPQEYMQAHEWRGQIEKEAQALGGLDNVPMALKWSRMLFGLETPPEGVSPAAHFMDELWQHDRHVYREVLKEIANEHSARLIPHLEDAVLTHHKIPKDRLPEIQDFLRYGNVSASEAAHREFVGLLKPELQPIFAKLKPAQQNFYVDQVDRGYMSLEFAEQEIAEKGLLQAIDGERAQAKDREAEATKLADERRAKEVAFAEIGRYQEAFVSAYVAKHGIAPEDVLEKVAFVAGTLDDAASENERHPAKIAYDDLLDAAASGNPLRIKAAMNRLRVVFEEAFENYMASRSGKAPAPASGHQPPGQPPPSRQPQFEPDKPNAGEDWSNVPLDDYLFGRAALAAR